MIENSVPSLFTWAQVQAMNAAEWRAALALVDLRCAERVAAIDAIAANPVADADVPAVLGSVQPLWMQIDLQRDMQALSHRLGDLQLGTDGDAELERVWHWYGDINAAWERCYLRRCPELLAANDAADARAVVARALATIARRP